MKNIYLIGMMGSGKTIVAKALAHEMMLHVEDLDERIVEREKRSINDIFAASGEDYFRRVEHEVLSDISKQDNIVVATGGGIILDPKNIACMQNTGVMVYLQAPTDVLVSRLQNETDRPLLKTVSPADTLNDIYLKRRSLYEKAQYVINTTDKKPFEIAAEIIEMLAQEGKL